MDFAALWLTLLLSWIFILGACVGSFLNVCIYRLPRGKPLSWPGSRCGSCFTRIPASENIPILGYWLLGGKCPRCQATFSPRYFVVELLTAVAFTALFSAEVGWNSQRYPPWGEDGWWRLAYATFPDYSVTVFLAHATLASLMIVAVGTLLDTGRIPWEVVIFGMVAGLGASCFLPRYFVPGGGLAGVTFVPAFLRLMGASRGAVGAALLTGGFVGWQISAVALLASAPFLVLRKDGPVLYLLALAVAWQARGFLPFRENVPW
jgi:leader peptidase (prepilin peptidase)/N-methyltransferase